MIQEQCSVCHDPVQPHDPSENADHETPLEHFERTGHQPNKAIPYACSTCGNVWPYNGTQREYVTCPHCSQKTTFPLLPTP